EIAQDRGKEKKFLNDIGIPTAHWRLADSAKEARQNISDMDGNDFIIKTTRFGYDGKGQISCRKTEDIDIKWKSLNSKHTIIEQMIDFACEISVIIARDKLGQTATYGPVLNEHHNH